MANGEGRGGPGGGEGGLSRTSQAVALLRAELDRPSTPRGDSGAQRALCEGMRPVPAGARQRLLPQLAARTRFFDDLVLRAMADGVRQVVVCGAGFDDRALRFRTPGVRFFELDQPATQAHKAGRLRAIGARTDGLTLAAADFRADDPAAVLRAAGHEADRPSLFLCEGLLVYLDRPTCVRLLGGLRSVAAAGSTLAASLAVHRPGADSAQVAAVANAGRRAGRTEPWLTILPLDAHLALLARSGWHVARTTDAVELNPDAAPGRTLLATATPGPGPGPQRDGDAAAR